MMKISCCSKNKTLLEKLQSLYGAGNIIGVSDSDSDLLEMLNSEKCDVAILDLEYCSLPQADGFSVPLVVLAGVPTFKEGFSLLQRGVRGYGNRHMREVNLQQAIDNVFGGQIWLPPDLVSQLIDVVGTKDKSAVGAVKEDLLNRLSKRECEVALLVAQGMSNQEVADEVFVSLRTVKAHLGSIYRKTGIRNRLELGLALTSSF